MTTPQTPEDNPTPSPAPGDMLAALNGAPDDSASAPPEAEAGTSPQPATTPEPQATPEGTPAEPTPSPTPEATELNRQLEERNQQIAQYEQVIAEQRQANAAAERQQQAAQIQANSRQYQQQLQDEHGISPELAAQIATRDARMAQSLVSQQAELQAKNQTAQGFATQYGVSVDSLLNMDSPLAMEAEAKRQSEGAGFQKQLDELRAQVSQSLAPVQNFAGGAGASPALNTDANFLAGMGDAANPSDITEDSKKRFWQIVGRR